MAILPEVESEKVDIFMPVGYNHEDFNVIMKIKLMFIGQSARLVILSERSESKDLRTEYLHRRLENA